jgi:hypothetical protein
LAIRLNTAALPRGITIRRHPEIAFSRTIPTQTSSSIRHGSRHVNFIPMHTAAARSHCRDVSAPPAGVEVLAKQFAFFKAHPLLSTGTKGV